LTTVGKMGTYNVSQWYFLATVYNYEASTISIYVDNAAPVTAAVAGGSSTSDVVEFTIGTQSNGVFYMDGLIDEVGGWRRALSAGEVAQLRNGGTGLTYPF